MGKIGSIVTSYKSLKPIKIVCWLFLAVWIILTWNTLLDNHVYVNMSPSIARFREAQTNSNDFFTEYDTEQFNIMCRGVDVVYMTETTNADYSKLDVYEQRVTNEYILNVRIKAFNKRNEHKTRGGDLLFVLSKQVYGDGKMASPVIDHDNGTYSAHLRFPWTGTTKVWVNLATKLENSCLRFQTMKAYGTSVFAMTDVWGFKANFANKNNVENTYCLPSETIFGYKSACNLTMLNDNLHYFCGLPYNSHLRCEDLQYTYTGSFDGMRIIINSVKVDLSVAGKLSRVVIIDVPRADHFAAKEISHCSKVPKALTWQNITDRVAGYWLNKTWHVPICESNIEHTVEKYRHCLKGREMFFFGDSTARQYADYFVNEVLEKRPKIDLRMLMFGHNTYNWRNTFSSLNINVTFLKHAMPFSGDKVPVNGVTSVYTELSRLSKTDIPGEQLIFFIVYHSHLQPFPVSFYKDRIRKLVISIKDFLSLKPKALFFLKSPSYVMDQSNRWVDNKMSLLYIKILLQEFESLHDRVVYLDTWSINVIHETISIHPETETLMAQIKHFMSFIC
ncbi:hypothetical protein DPMN_156133 [Dreissena polymorpha]|uniref:NXPE C-terminal domain-containing protein n=2 Tax=Dreissena polymorpha TaxID=45954 RepID=A0A9D4FQP1_DREPO|nr:hypothetical protein DPMN_156133 [Dreissena polymorpha]